MERGPKQGLGRLVLEGLAITSALTFLTVVMVNACATASRPATGPTYGAPTKAAPVLPPGKLHEPATQAPTQAPPAEPATPAAPVYAAPTKAAPVLPPRPLMQAPPQQAPQQAPAPQQRGAR